MLHISRCAIEDVQHHLEMCTKRNPKYLGTIKAIVPLKLINSQKIGMVIEEGLK